MVSRVAISGLVVLVALALGASTVRAQSLAEALDEAARSGPETELGRARVAAADTEEGVAGVLPNPRVTIGSTVNYARLYGTVVFQLALFGQLDEARAAARRGAELASQDEAVRALGIAESVTRAWVELWLAEHETALAERARDRAARLAEAAVERLQTGTAPRLDAVRLAAEAARLRAESRALAVREQAARARLGVWLGRDAARAAELHATGDPPRWTPGPLAAARSRTRAHPRLERADALVAAADAVVSREERARFPLIGVELGANALYAAGNGPDAHVALIFNVPLFDLDAPIVRRAQAQAAVARLEREAEAERVEAELVAAHADAVAATELADALEAEVVPAATEAATLASQGYTDGLLGLDAALAAEQARDDAERSAVRAAAERARALATLARALGGAP